MNDDLLKHPWYSFLESRKKAIDWLYNTQKLNDVEIARTLSMDGMQVFLIRTYDWGDLKSHTKEPWNG